MHFPPAHVNINVDYFDWYSKNSSEKLLTAGGFFGRIMK